MLGKINWGWVCKWGLVALVFYVMCVLKLHGYDRYPTPSHGEELLYGWSGIHLVETGVPVSWSTLEYPKKNKFAEGIFGEKDGLNMGATLWKPWLDEPPVYSWMVGQVAHSYGDDRMKVIPPSHSRIPSVFASLAVTALVFAVGYSFFGYGIGLLSMTFYGLSPILVFGSRLSVPENMIALGVVLMLWLSKYYEKSPKIWYAILGGVMSAVLGLMKPTGYFLAPLLMFVAIKKRRWLDSGIILALTLIGVGLFVMYGNSLDPVLFRKIVEIQGGRYAGWTGLGYVLVSPAIDIFNTFDGWYIFGLLFALFFSMRKVTTKEMSLLVLFFFYWLIIATISGTEQDLLPWYRYPLFPMIAIFGALGIAYTFKRPSFALVTLFVGLMLSGRYMVANEFRPTTPPNVYRVLYFLFLLPSLIEMAWGVKWMKYITRMVLAVVLILGIYYNARYVYSVFEFRCESKICAFGPSTKYSEMKLPLLWRFLIPGDSTDMLTTKRPWF